VNVRSRRRVVIVSHPAVLAVNQLPYAALLARGWDPWLVVPARWRHDHAEGDVAAEHLDELAGRVLPRRVVPAGAIQRHLYVTSPGRLLRELKPDVAFIEAESTSLAAAQWGWALHRAGVPFGVQADENLHRDFPLAARLIRRWVDAHAAFVAVRSPAAARLVTERAPRLPAPLVPHHVAVPKTAPARAGDGLFTVGFAGRLVPEKGLDTLADAVAGMSGVRLRLIGNGSMRAALEARRERGEPIEIVTGVRHEDMPEAYAQLDVLVLPSLTTPRWSEQFGRVLVEALASGVPVVGSSSGEIPWVIDSTRGGLVFPEGDVAALRSALERLRGDPALRASLAQAGGDAARARFSVERVAEDLEGALEAALP
jgi:glycosyltransferase involved in cell wall biosynthesis